MEIFQPHGPTFLRVVEAGLQGEDVTFPQDALGAGGFLEGGKLVDIEAHAVAEIVDVAAGGARLGDGRRVARGVEAGTDGFLHLPAAHSRARAESGLVEGLAD